MSPDLLDHLRTADPDRDLPDAPAPDWVALATLAVAALVPGDQPSVIDRAYAAVSDDGIYHYVSEFRELEGPERRPIADAHSRSEGWISPSTDQLHEIGAGGDETVRHGRRHEIYFAPGNSIQEFEEPPMPAGSEAPPANVFEALTRSHRVGALRFEATTTYEGRRVHRLVTVNPDKTFRQTFLVDADSYLPVLWLTETGDYIRTGARIPDDQRVMQVRYERFERLPDDTDRSVLEMRPHPGAQRGGGGPPVPRPAPSG